ncbi:hypothetical protein Slin15195_G128810 [Septoria linicola]|uniref:Uncharacterized protein n=1 Tax=Septoria linicola TaxID=215465 RepID=A0A9Q9B941_9PEZI|nr:hypothetical protein Slin15195_G128810 [Septoria linicola]
MSNCRSSTLHATIAPFAMFHVALHMTKANIRARLASKGTSKTAVFLTVATHDGFQVSLELRPTRGSAHHELLAERTKVAEAELAGRESRRKRSVGNENRKLEKLLLSSKSNQLRHTRGAPSTSRPQPGGYVDRRHTSKSLSSDEDVGSASFDSGSVDFDRATSEDNESTFSTKSRCAAKDNPQYSPESQHRDDEETIIKQEVQQDIKMSQRRRRRRRPRGLIQAVQGSRSEDENAVIIEFDNTENGRELAEDVRKLEELLNGAKVRYEKGKRAWSAEH